MKYVKMLGLAAVAAAALMAFVGAGTASATVLCKVSTLTTGCSAANEDYGANTVIEATSTGVGVLKSGSTILDECEDSTLVGKTSNTGSSSETVKGPITTLDWGTCTKDTTTIKNGELEIHWISGSDNGTITVSGTEVTINTIFGTCVYTTSDVGVLEGGKPAKISIVNLKVKKTSGNFACPAETEWTDSFEVKSPSPLFVSTS